MCGNPSSAVANYNCVSRSMYRFSTSLLSTIFLFCFHLSFSAKQKHFTKFGKGGVLNSINVLSNHSVLSSLECGQYCLRYETCQGFNYKSARMIYEDNDINCQLSKQNNMKQNNMNDSEWMYYKALSLSEGADHSACEHGGKCRDGSCECDVKYEGQRCERERVFKSCSEVLSISSDAKDGVYKIKTETTSNHTSAYCQMTSLVGCAGGGWTMVMKINGSKRTFEYNSTLWENKESFNIEAGQTALDFEETKLPTFWSTSFKELCIGMKVGNDLNCLSFSYPASSLYSLFADRIYRSTNITRGEWKSLLAGSSLQTGCRKQGFNVDASLYVDVRLGYIANEQQHCYSTDSYIGIGSNSDNKNSWCHSPWPTTHVNIAGNLAGCFADNGFVDITAMAYLLVR